MPQFGASEDGFHYPMLIGDDFLCDFLSLHDIGCMSDRQIFTHGEFSGN